MVSDRILARSQLEFRFMGIVFRRAPDRRKAVFAEVSEKGARMAFAYLCAGARRCQLGALAFEDVSKRARTSGRCLVEGRAGVWNGNASYYLGANALLIAACALFSTNFAGGLFRTDIAERLFRTGFAGRLGKRIKAREAFGESACAALRIVAFSALFLLSVCFLVGDSYNPFLYFRF